jgi:peroxiredoxin
MRLLFPVFAIALSALACRSKTPTDSPSVSGLQPEPQPLQAQAAVSPDKGASGPAALGATAPDFKLPDLDGNQVSLSSFRGKTVVLEWFNPGCPFVKASHSKGSLKDAAARHAANGVVWLAINSGAPGKQGAGREANVEGRERFGLKHPILLDESGSVGRAYGAAHTPHMFIVNPEGKLVYRGAIDNSPDGEGESPKSGSLVNHVDVALSELTQGKPISVAETEAYGCSVKYGS